MPVTEEQAKTKKCSEMRNYRRVDLGYECEFGLCVGSDCMMWRWQQVEIEVGADIGVYQKGESRMHGYCGLAGQEE